MWACARAPKLAQRERSAALHARIVELRGSGVRETVLAPLDAKLSDLERRISRAALEVFSVEELQAGARRRLEEAAADITIATSPPANAKGSAKGR
jgi:hypothetical protein